jgi:hypothetical protein
MNATFPTKEVCTKPGVVQVEVDRVRVTALRYFTLDGSDYPSHTAQENAIAGYVRWRNKHAKPKRRFAIDSKIRRPDYLPNVA